MIFQEPMTALNPVHRVGKQLMETIELYEPELEASARQARAIELLEHVGIPAPEQRLREAVVIAGLLRLLQGRRRQRGHRVAFGVGLIVAKPLLKGQRGLGTVGRVGRHGLQCEVEQFAARVRGNDFIGGGGSQTVATVVATVRGLAGDDVKQEPAHQIDVAGGTDLLHRPDGGFEAQLAHPLAHVAGVNAALWGDMDNDGLLDVYLLRRGPNQLWRQVEKNNWQDVTAASMSAGGDADTRDGLWLDADHDGDLDLFLVNADAPNELLNNNLDGTFRPLAQERGIAGRGTGNVVWCENPRK